MVDLIRSGKAPEVIRRKGAEGKLPVPVEETIEILTLLASAPEAELRAKALDTIQSWNGEELRGIMADPNTTQDVLRFGAAHLLASHKEMWETLLRNRRLPPDSRELLQPTRAAKPAVVAAVAKPIPPQPEPPPPPPTPAAALESPGNPEPAPVPKRADEEVAVEILAKLAAGAKVEEVTGEHGDAPPEVTKRDDQLTQQDRETLIEKVNRMTVVEKIKAALTGNMETRVLLIRDSNKIISRAVLQSPKISDTEAESYAAAKNVSEEVLRLIATNRKFMKTYSVMRALINNPRAPIDITMPLLGRINERDLKGLALNRNVPEVIRSLAIKMMKQKEEAGKVKLPGKH
jgi:hypothetical protein